MKECQTSSYTMDILRYKDEVNLFFDPYEIGSKEVDIVLEIDEYLRLDFYHLGWGLKIF